MFFEPHTSTGCGVFAILGRVFDHFCFSQILSLREKTLKNTNLVFTSGWHALLKTPLLKLPYNKTRTKTRSRRGSRINTDRFPKRAPKAQAFGGSGGMSQWEIFFDFSIPKSHFGFLSHSDRIIWPVPSPRMKPCNLIHLLWKIWPISVKQWKPCGSPPDKHVKHGFW